MEFHQEKNSCLKYPMGFRFCPTPHQVFVSYLQPKITNDVRCWWIRSMIHDGTLNEGVDILQHHPWELPGMNQHTNEAYYFYERRMKSEAVGATKCNRTIKNSTAFWRMSTKEEIMEKTGPGKKDVKPWGVKHTLNYLAGPKAKSQWLMHEYVLDSSRAPSGDHNLVFCKVYKKVDKKRQGCDPESNDGPVGLKRKRASSKVEFNSVDTQIPNSLTDFPVSDELFQQRGCKEVVVSETNLDEYFLEQNGFMGVANSVGVMGDFQLPIMSEEDIAECYDLLCS